MNELIKRLEYAKKTTTSPIADQTIDEAIKILSRLGPYEPGEEIEVSQSFDFSPVREGRFVGFKSNGYIVVEFTEKDKVGRVDSFHYHRPTPKTIDLKGFPVELVDWSKKSEADDYITLKDYCDKAEQLRKAIVACAKDKA